MMLPESLTFVIVLVLTAFILFLLVYFVSSFVISCLHSNKIILIADDHFVGPRMRLPERTTLLLKAELLDSAKNKRSRPMRPSAAVRWQLVVKCNEFPHDWLPLLPDTDHTERQLGPIRSH